jgi:Universal stress protein UspA and related nucleotide-binding proteins
MIAAGEPAAMFETIVVATDGSDSVSRAVTVALDVAARFDATVHALSVIDADASNADNRRAELNAHAENALAAVESETDQPVVTTVREGEPAAEIIAYAEEVGADLVTTGTRGRHGENRFLLGSVAERVVRLCPVPVLTVRQLAAIEGDTAVDAA